MKRVAVLSLLLLVAVACGGTDGGTTTPTPSPTPRLEVPPGAVDDAVLRSTDIGPGWKGQKDIEPSTIQIGGEVGAANVKDPEQDATTAFTQENASGFVTNSVFLLDSTDIAAAWVDRHRQVSEDRWTQERQEGGGTTFERTGEVAGLPSLGDEMFSAAIDAIVVDEDGDETPRKIEYVVYRIDRLLAFVIAQDVGVSRYARLQEQKVARLTS